MAKRVVFSDEARADIRAIDRETALTLLTALDRCLKTEVGKVKQTGRLRSPAVRLRVGDWRTIFRKSDAEYDRRRACPQSPGSLPLRGPLPGDVSSAHRPGMVRVQWRDIHISALTGETSARQCSLLRPAKSGENGIGFHEPRTGHRHTTRARNGIEAGRRGARIAVRVGGPR